jgi:hypothetical protein
MKSLLILLILFENSYAWEIVGGENSTFVEDKQYQVKEEIISHPTIRKLETKELGNNIILLTYLENLGGTKTPSETYNCAAFSKNSKKAIFKDLACRSILNQRDGKQEVEEASFKIEGGKIFYTFDEIKKAFDIPK